MLNAAYLGVRQRKFLMLIRAGEKLQRTVFDSNGSYPSAPLSGRSVRKMVRWQTKSSMAKRLPTRRKAKSSASLPAGTPFSPLMGGCFRKMGTSGCAGWRAAQPEGAVVCRVGQKPNKGGQAVRLWLTRTFSTPRPLAHGYAIVARSVAPC